MAHAYAVSERARPIRPTRRYHMKISNFGKNVVFQPKDLFAPRSEEEVLSILRDCRGRRIRVVGRLHSWSDAARGNDVLLDLRHLNSVRTEERDGDTWATIGGGCQIKRVLSELDRQARVTLPSLGLITEQTIAGATSTGTHGSGKHSLSHYVEEVRVATYDAETGEPVVQTIDNGNELRSARCSLGCLGVILSVKLRCRAQYQVEEHLRKYRNLDEVLQAENDYPLQQFFMVPWSWKFLVQHRREVDRSRSVLASLYRAYWFLVVDLSLHLNLQLIVKIVRSRWLVHTFYRWIVWLTVLRRWKVVDKSQDMLTMEHELFRHIEIEVFVKRSKLKGALDFTRSLIEFCDGDPDAFDEPTEELLSRHGLMESVQPLLGKYTHHYAITVRKVLPDATLISMASSDDEPYYAISFISYHRPRERDGFFQFANVLAETTSRLFEARPHWGKVCPIDSQLVQKLYPHLPEFRRICEAMDPDGVFRNEWVDSLIFDNASKSRS